MIVSPATEIARLEAEVTKLRADCVAWEQAYVKLAGALCSERSCIVIGPDGTTTIASKAGSSSPPASDLAGIPRSEGNWAPVVEQPSGSGHSVSVYVGRGGAGGGAGASPGAERYVVSWQKVVEPRYEDPRSAILARAFRAKP